MSKAETGRLCVGVDLHKTQFTISALNEDGEYLLEKQYPTKEEGYSEFAREINILIDIAARFTYTQGNKSDISATFVAWMSSIGRKAI